MNGQTMRIELTVAVDTAERIARLLSWLGSPAEAGFREAMGMADHLASCGGSDNDEIEQLRLAIRLVRQVLDLMDVAATEDIATI